MIGKIFWLRARRKLLTLLYKPIKNIYAMIFLKRILKRKKQNEVVIPLATQLGDSIYGVAFIDAFKQKYPDKFVVVIGQKKYENIFRSYASIDKLILINSPKQYKYIDAYIRAPYISGKGLKYGVIPTIPLFYKNIFKEKNIDTLYQLRKSFGVMDNAPISYHNVELTDIKVIHDFESKKNRIAILNPYSTALFNANIDLFKILCNVLTDAGYIVYTNVIKGQKEITGSLRLNCSLEELFSIAKGVPVIVSVRSGILDYLIPSGINIFAIYDNCFERWIKMYNIKSWNGSGQVKEIYRPKKEDYQNVADDLKLFLEGLKN